MAPPTKAPRKPAPPRSAPKSTSRRSRAKSSDEIRVEGDVVQRGPAPKSGEKKGAPQESKGKKKDAKSKTPKGKTKDGKPKGSKGKKNKGKKAKPEPRVFTAKGADRHELYQLSVQSPEEDVKFFRRVYKSFRKKDALHFREDFCGTALLCSQWVKRGKKFTAEGFDIDPDPVGWGLEHNFAPLGEAASRAKIHLKDVREPSSKKPDVRIATNFSWWIFQTREELLGYFKSAREDLAKGGVFVLDIYGGPESFELMEEERDIEEGFTYVWDQDEYWPATGEYKSYIHFRFDDGTELKNAFRYTWRCWGLTEAMDVLRDAGFSEVHTYWEGTDEDGESGNGIYRRSRRGENCEAWVTYIVALK